VEATLEHICVKEEEGAILVFLTGWDEISKLIERLKSNPVLNDSSRFLMLPLHGSMPTINQREIFQRPPRGVRYYLLASQQLFHRVGTTVMSTLMVTCMS
jgi:ATP-dependent RNA helicase DHX36